MTTLDLPPGPPLPADVRERVLHVVGAGTRLRAATVIAAAAAVLAALALMTSVALTDDVTGINPLARPAVTPRPDITAREERPVPARCGAAARTSQVEATGCRRRVSGR